jgi:dihydrodipicolinate synthase/N-acetylneuraminate lyase
MALQGVIVPLVTPFDEQFEMNESVLRQLIERLVVAGVDGVMVAGTTGEGPLLSMEERMRQAEIAVEQVNERCAVISQVGTIATMESVLLAQHAVACGVQAIAIVAPYYFRLSDEAMRDHFCKIIGAIPGDFPAYLYYIPQCTGNSISPAVSEQVAQRYPNLVGEKESSGDLNLLATKLATRGGKFDLFIGSDALILSALVLGAQGMVAGNANLFPELFAQLYKAYRDGSLTDAEAAQRRIQISIRACKADRSLFKAVLRYQGLAVGDVRLPQAQASPEAISTCMEILVQAGLLPGEYSDRAF